MKKVIIFIAVVSLATALVLIFLNSAWVTEKVRTTLVRLAKKSLNAEIAIDAVSFGLFPPSVELKGLALKPLLEIPKARIVLNPLQLFVGKITIREVKVTGLQGKLSIVDGKPRLPFELPASTKSPGRKGPVSAISSIAVNSIVVKDASLDLSFDKPDLHVLIPRLTADIHPDMRSRRFPFSFSLDRAALTYDKKPLPEISLHGEGVSRGEELAWKRIEIGLAAATITVSGTLSGFRKPRLDLRTEGHVALDTGRDILRQWIANIPELQGTTAWDISLSGVYPDIKARGTLDVHGGRIGKFVLEDMSSSFSIDRESVDIPEAVFRNAGGVIEAAGKIGLAGDMPVRAGVTMDGVSFARLLDNLTVKRSKVESTVSTKASLSGALRGSSGFILEGDADTFLKDFKVTKKGYQDTEGNEDIIRIKSAKINSRIAIDKEKVRISSATVDTGSYVLLADGDLRYNDTFSISFTSESMDITSLSPLGHIPIAGKGMVYGQIVGLYSNPLITGRVNLSRAGLLGWDIGTARGSVRYQALRLSFPGMSVTRGNSTYSCAAEVTFGDPVGMTLKVSVAKGRLEDIIGIWAQRYVDSLAIKGDVEGEVTLEGPLTALNGSGKMTIANAGVLGEMFSHGTAAGRMEDGGLRVDGITLYKEKGSLSLNGALSKNGELSVDLVSHGVNLEEIDTMRRSHYPASGFLSFDAHLGGMFRNPEGAGNCIIQDMKIAGEAYGDSAFRLNLRDGILSASGNVVGKEMTMDSATDLRSQGRYDVSLKMDDTDLMPFLWTINKDLRLGGRATGVLSLQGVLWGQGRSGGTIDLTSLEVKEGVSLGEGYTIVNDGPVVVEWKEGAWTFESFTMKEKGQKPGVLSLKGTLDGNTVDMTAKASFDLYPLSLFFPSLIQSSEGPMDIDITARGPRTSPSLTGSLALRNCSLLFTGLPARFEGVDVEAAARGNTITILRSRARVGKGEILGRGLMRFSGLTPSFYDYSAGLKGIDMTFSREASALFDGTLAFRGPATAPTLSGDIAVREARVTQWKDWQSLLWERLLKKYRGDIGVHNEGGILLDVKVAADKGLHVKYGLAQAELKGKGAIVGTIRAPSFIGGLEFIKGSIYYLDNRFDISAGSITFSDYKEFVPVIDVSAVAVKRRVKDMRTASGEVKEWKNYKILLHASGRPEDLKIALSSEPSDLSEAEIYSVLAAGVIGGEEYGGLALGEATAYGFILSGATRALEKTGKLAFGSDETEKTGDIVRDYLVDTIQLSPSSEAGTTSPRITVGKSWGEHWEYSASTETGGKGGGRFEVRYTVNKRLSLLGDWDNDSAILMGNPNPEGNFGGNIVYTLRFR